MNYFGYVPVVISDGQLMNVKHAATVSPFPLYTTPSRRAISQPGLAMIVAEARADGLLGPMTSFDCPDDKGLIVAGGAGPDYLEMVANGVRYELSSSCPDAGAIPTPTMGTSKSGTWAAFQRFRELLSNPSSWLGSEIGPAVVYDPDTLAVLALPVDPSAGTPSTSDVRPWPLATPFASFGVAYAEGRCAVVTGRDAAALLPVVKSAYVESVFRDADGALAALVVRVFMPGEPDPCAAG